jgi:hypothetical protein
MKYGLVSDVLKVELLNVTTVVCNFSMVCELQFYLLPIHEARASPRCRVETHPTRQVRIGGLFCLSKGLSWLGSAI